MTSVSAHRDERGDLVAIEHDSLPFVVRRTFVVSGPGTIPVRGGHRTTCVELLILVCGSAAVRLGGAEPHDVQLLNPGDRIQLARGEYITYELAPPCSSILVLADAPYEPRS